MVSQEMNDNWRPDLKETIIQENIKPNETAHWAVAPDLSKAHKYFMRNNQSIRVRLNEYKQYIEYMYI